jgi:hypothetical protein
VVWLVYKATDLTANARAVIDQTSATVLAGDVKQLVGELGQPCNPGRSTAPPTVIHDIFAALSAREVDLWRTRIFGEIGCGKEAATAASRLLARAASEAEEVEALAEHARAVFHMGYYRYAAAEYRRCVEAFRPLGNGPALRGALHGLAESSRCAGKFIQAMGAIRAVSRMARESPDPAEREEAEVSAAVLRITLRRHLYQTVAKIPGKPGVRWIRAAAARDLKTVTAPAAASGGWLFLAQARLWADRYQVPWSEVYSGPMRITGAGESYGQLGYMTARIMALRDRLARGDSAAAAAIDLQVAFDTLYEIGSFPEAWKFARLVRKKLGAGVLTEESFHKAADAWRGCQYTPLMRLLQRLSPS